MHLVETIHSYTPNITVLRAVSPHNDDPAGIVVEPIITNDELRFHVTLPNMTRALVVTFNVIPQEIGSDTVELRALLVSHPKADDLVAAATILGTLSTRITRRN